MRTIIKSSIESSNIEPINTLLESKELLSNQEQSYLSFIKESYAIDESNSKLKVSFFRPFYGDYWVLMLDENYKYAVVGTPSREYLWILARTSKLDEKIKKDILKKLPSLGFDTSKLIWTIQE